MNILSHVRDHAKQKQRLSEAQAAHLRARAYRGVEMPETRRLVVKTIDGKRYSCQPLED